MKIFKLLLALAISLSLVYCSDNDNGDTSPLSPDTENTDSSDNNSNPTNMDDNTDSNNSNDTGNTDENTNETEDENPKVEEPVKDNTKGTITFTKENNADPKLEANQDRITDKVWITRGNKGEIYNIATEEFLTKGSSPAGTEWALGTTKDLNNLAFKSFRNTLESKIQTVVGKDLVLHLIEENLYFDVKFSQWTSGSGGGFSYTRTLFEAQPTPEAKLLK